MTRFLSLILTACLPAVLFFANGCGGSGRPNLVEATGTVTLDGKPVEEAMVSFMPDPETATDYKRPSIAVTDANGKFTLGTYDKTDGAPTGKYLVVIQKREPVGKLPENYDSEQAEKFNVKYRLVIPRKYSNPKTSGLRAEITSSGIEPAVFELKSDGPPEIEATGPRSRANEP